MLDDGTPPPTRLACASRAPEVGHHFRAARHARRDRAELADHPALLDDRPSARARSCRLLRGRPGAALPAAEPLGRAFEDRPARRARARLPAAARWLMHGRRIGRAGDVRHLASSPGTDASARLSTRLVGEAGVARRCATPARPAFRSRYAARCLVQTLSEHATVASGLPSPHRERAVKTVHQLVRFGTVRKLGHCGFLSRFRHELVELVRLGHAVGVLVVGDEVEHRLLDRALDRRLLDRVTARSGSIVRPSLKRSKTRGSM